MRFHPPATAADPESVRAAWRDFVVSGAVDPARVRAPIAQAWQRSAAAGCSPYQARANVLAPSETMELIRREERLVEIAAPFLAALSRAAGTHRHAAMLGDGSGRVLKIVGDAETMADDNFPRAGSLLSEQTAGANGIGTALAEGRYVELVGAEHYIEGFHVFTCQGVPLLGPGDQPVGVLSMSVRREETAARVRDILFCASEAAECELLSQRLSDTLAAAAPLEQVLESLRQDIVQRVAMARLQFELAARQIAGGADAAATLSAAQQLIRKFRRQAAVWRNLVGQGAAAPEPVRLDDLVDDLVGLLETEARVAAVQLRWADADRAVVLADVQALSQRLLGAFLNVIQRSGPGAVIGVQVRAEQAQGRASVRAPLPDGTAHEEHVRAPLLR